MQQRKFTYIPSVLTLCALALSVSACDRPAPAIIMYPVNVDTTNIYQLEELRQYRISKNAEKKIINPIRTEAVKQAALMVGAQGGLAKRSWEINTVLTQDTNDLNKVYRFSALMLSDNVLPPVLVQGDNPLNLNDQDTIRLADKTYKIELQARFVTAPPTWREYLWMAYQKPDIPDKSILPKNYEELAIWRRYVRLGWQQGMDQANAIFSVNLGRLTRDYQGMALYRKLLDEHMISSPFVAKTNLGVTGDGSKISINDQILRITAKPQLNTDSQTWMPVLAPPFSSSNEHG